MDEVQLGSRTLQPHRQLLVNGHREPIGKRALDILSVLAEAGGEIVTKDELLEQVWPGVIVEENALQVHVVALRKALGPEAERLKTIRAVGYQLRLDPAAVEKIGEPARSLISSSLPSGTDRNNPAIVVLPFDNISADPEQSYFADGITEDIITDLAKVSALQVVARNTAFSFRGQHIDLRDVAKQLGVDFVLEGSVRKSGDRVRVTAQLIEASSGGHVWAERYDRNLVDIFEIQDELSEAIVGALKVRLLPQEKAAIGDRETRNAEAYDYYLKARALRATMNLSQIPLSLHAYRKAIEVDPDFALAWAGLASSMIQNRAHFPRAEGLTDDEINHALDRAEQLAPDSLDVLAARSQRAIFDHDWDSAAECIDRFRDRGDGHWSIFSHLLLILGKAREAAIQQELVRGADPLSIGGAWALQFHLACAGRFDEAEEEYQRSLVLPGGFRSLRWEAIKRKVATGQFEAARDQFVTVFATGMAFLSCAGPLAEVLEDRAKASELLRASLLDPSAQDQLSLITVADCAVLIGDDDLAFAAMRAAFIEARGLMVIELWHPIYLRLRADARFKDLLTDLGLVDYWRRTGDWGDFARPLGETDFEVIA